MKKIAGVETAYAHPIRTRSDEQLVPSSHLHWVYPRGDTAARYLRSQTSPRLFEDAMPTGWPISSVDVDVDIATRWWLDYPVKHFNRLSRASDLHKEFVEESFFKTKRLARSLSASRFELCKEVEFDYPIRKSGSISSLSPSHALTFAERTPTRYIAHYEAFKPGARTDFYYKTYAPKKTQMLLDRVKKPWSPPSHYYIPKATDYYPELKSTVSRIYWEQRYRKPGYVEASDRYLNSWVGARLKMLGYNMPWIYTTFDQGPTLYSTFDRHVRAGNVFYSHVPRVVPRTYYRTIAPRYAYKGYGYFLSDRF